jgi:hypothetical protein
MNFHNPSVTKYLVLGPLRDFRQQPYPFNFTGFISATPNLIYPSSALVNDDGALDNGWNMGRVINVLFDPLTWTQDAVQVTIQAVGSGVTPTGPLAPILVAPNLIINDPAQAAYTTFLKGNPVYPNGKLWDEYAGSLGDYVDGAAYISASTSQGTASTCFTPDPLTVGYTQSGAMSVGEVRINYTAVLNAVVPAGARADLPVNQWVLATDTIEIIPDNFQYSNICAYNRVALYDGPMDKGAAPINPYPVITAVRRTNNLNDWAIEFSAMIDNSGQQAYLPEYLGSGRAQNPSTGTSSSTAYVSNEIYYYFGQDAGNLPIVKGLAKHNLSAKVVGRDVAGAVVFFGNLAAATNLTHCLNNSASRISEFYSAPGLSTVTINDFKASARPITVAVSAASINTGTTTITLAAGASYHGTQPFKSLAIYDPNSTSLSTTVVAITVTPL